jgi:NAD(P)-dependent dehydrogenase (short-subunit alcohol dehydrogenase family)
VRLENKVAVVMGSSSGIGEAIALAFAEEGAAVVVNYSRHEDAAQKVLEKIEGFGGKGLVVGADVSDPKARGRRAGGLTRSYVRLSAAS